MTAQVFIGAKLITYATYTVQSTKCYGFNISLKTLIQCTMSNIFTTFIFDFNTFVTLF